MKFSDLTSEIIKTPNYTLDTEPIQLSENHSIIFTFVPARHNWLYLSNPSAVMDTVVPGDDIPSALRRLLYLCTDFWYSNNGKKEAFTDDDGNKIELSVEALSNLPLSFINEATEAIWKACNENPTLKSG